MSDPDSHYYEVEALQERVGKLETALREIQGKQPATLSWLREHKIVFDDLGTDPSNWQHVAYGIYTDLVEVEVLAREALRNE